MFPARREFWARLANRAYGPAGYPASMSTSPVDPEDVRAAAEAFRELGPEYNDAVVAAFIDRVDRALAARVEARLAAERAQRPEPAERRWQPAPRRPGLVKGVALGLCAGALVAGVSISHVHSSTAHVARTAVPRAAPPGPPAPPGP